MLFEESKAMKDTVFKILAYLYDIYVRLRSGRWRD